MPAQITVSLTTFHCLSIFHGIPDEQLEMLIPICSAAEYLQGDTIISAGELSSDFYIILSGSLKVVLRHGSDKDGKEREKEVLLSYLNSGDFFGELSMIDAKPRSAYVIADTDCCVVSMTGHNFREVIRRNADIAFHMLRNLALRLRNSDEKIRGFALKDVSSRVLVELETMADYENGQRVIYERVSRQGIAKRVGASREMVGRAIRDLEKRKLFKMIDNKIVLQQID